MVTDDNHKRDIIYKGINGFHDKLEIVTLWNDLRCTKVIKKMSISLEKSVPNLRKII